MIPLASLAFTDPSALGRLVSIAVVDIATQHGAPGPLVQNVTELIPQLRGGRIQGRSGRSILQERSNEEVFGAVGKGRGGAGDRLDALGGIPLEQEERVVEGRRAVCAGGKEVVDLLLGCGVVLGEVDGPTWVGKPGLLAGGCGEVDACPSG